MLGGEVGWEAQNFPEHHVCSIQIHTMLSPIAAAATLPVLLLQQLQP